MSNANKSNNGFTLVELLVVISILSLLIGLTLPAVQQIREAARRTQCGNNIRQQSLAILNFESSFETLPAGATEVNLHSWGSQILPQLEQENLFSKIDFEQAWNAPDSYQWTHKQLPIFRCPTSWKTYAGCTDYAGIRGSSNNTTKDLGFNGCLYPVAGRFRPVTFASITDGTSNTIVIAEAIAITEEQNGFWANGKNCIGHDDGPINNRNGGQDEIASLHPGGAQVAFVDGSVHFLNEQLSLDVISSLCTRNNSEPVIDY